MFETNIQAFCAMYRHAFLIFQRLGNKRLIKFTAFSFMNEKLLTYTVIPQGARLLLPGVTPVTANRNNWLFVCRAGHSDRLWRWRWSAPRKTSRAACPSGTTQQPRTKATANRNNWSPASANRNTRVFVCRAISMADSGGGLPPGKTSRCSRCSRTTRCALTAIQRSKTKANAKIFLFRSTKLLPNLMSLVRY